MAPSPRQRARCLQQSHQPAREARKVKLCRREGSTLCAHVFTKKWLYFCSLHLPFSYDVAGAGCTTPCTHVNFARRNIWTHPRNKLQESCERCACCYPFTIHRAF